jgi:hypothetical protein
MINIVNTANLPNIEEVFKKNTNEKIADKSNKTYTNTKADIDKDTWFKNKKDNYAEKQK